MTRRRRTRRLTTAATAHAPASADVRAAMDVVSARLLAVLRRAQGEPVEIPDRNLHAEAVVLAHARANGADLTPDGIAATRAALVERIARAVGL